MNVSSVTSNFLPTAQDGFSTTLGSSISSGATTVPLSATGSYSNGDIVCLMIDYGVSGKQATFTGVMNTVGLQVTNVVWTEGATATSHSAGATIVDNITATHLGILQKGLFVDHNPNGDHKSLHDNNGATWLGQTAAASAVNYVNIANAATGSPALIQATGADTNINLQAKGKGTGVFDPAIPYKFSVYRNAASNSPGSTGALLAMDTKLFDTGSNVDIVTNKGRFTAPAPGFWWFTARFSTNGGNDSFASLYKNGSEVLRGNRTAGSGILIGSNVTGMLQLSANDYVEAWAFTASSQPYEIGPINQYFHGCLISAT